MGLSTGQPQAIIRSRVRPTRRADWLSTADQESAGRLRSQVRLQSRQSDVLHEQLRRLRPLYRGSIMDTGFRQCARADRRLGGVSEGRRSPAVRTGRRWRSLQCAQQRTGHHHNSHYRVWRGKPWVHPGHHHDQHDPYEHVNQRGFVYGAGLDWTLLPHLGLRLQYRGNLYKASDLTSAFSSTNAFTHTAEPVIGIYFRL